MTKIGLCLSMKPSFLRFPATIRLAVLGASPAIFAKPALYIIGDSTVRNSTTGQIGWGDHLMNQFAPAKITFINRAISGHSNRRPCTASAGTCEKYVDHRFQ